MRDPKMVLLAHEIGAALHELDPPPPITDAQIAKLRPIFARADTRERKAA